MSTYSRLLTFLNQQTQFNKSYSNHIHYKISKYSTHNNQIKFKPKFNKQIKYRPTFIFNIKTQHPKFK
jgi:hypothetical protein